MAEGNGVCLSDADDVVTTPASIANSANGESPIVVINQLRY